MFRDLVVLLEETLRTASRWADRVDINRRAAEAVMDVRFYHRDTKAAVTEAVPEEITHFFSQGSAYPLNFVLDRLDERLWGRIWDHAEALGAPLG